MHPLGGSASFLYVPLEPAPKAQVFWGVKKNQLIKLRPQGG